MFTLSHYFITVNRLFSVTYLHFGHFERNHCTRHIVFLFVILWKKPSHFLLKSIAHYLIDRQQMFYIAPMMSESVTYPLSQSFLTGQTNLCLSIYLCHMFVCIFWFWAMAWGNTAYMGIKFSKSPPIHLSKWTQSKNVAF